MDRKEILARLRAARAAHIKWRSYAQGLLAGMPLEEDKVPVKHTACQFGQWYYGEGQALSHLPTYQAIEGPHDTLHAIYARIVETLFGQQPTPGLLARLFGRGKRDDALRQAKAEDLMEKLMAVSETLLVSLDLLEKEINALSDEDLQGY